MVFVHYRSRRIFNCQQMVSTVTFSLSLSCASSLGAHHNFFPSEVLSKYIDSTLDTLGSAYAGPTTAENLLDTRVHSYHEPAIMV